MPYIGWRKNNRSCVHFIFPLVRFRKRSGKLTRRKIWKVSTWEMLYKGPAAEAGPITSLLPTRSAAAATHTWEALTTRTHKAQVLGEARIAAATTKILKPSSSCLGSDRWTTWRILYMFLQPPVLGLAHNLFEWMYVSGLANAYHCGSTNLTKILKSSSSCLGSDKWTTWRIWYMMFLQPVS